MNLSLILLDLVARSIIYKAYFSAVDSHDIIVIQLHMISDLFKSHPHGLDAMLDLELHFHHLLINHVSLFSLDHK